MSDIAKFLGVWKEHTKPKLLLEIEDEYIQAVRPEIREAESGTSTDMPFNDIFGMPTPDNPRTRMVMPYGNPDIDLLKYILVNIKGKLVTEYRDNPNIDSIIDVGWDVASQTTMQDVRPLGWREGDPLQKVEKEVGNLVLQLQYKSSMGEKKTINKTLPISTLLKKYTPEYFDWWQGVKGKVGKYSFFTQNPRLLKDIVSDAEDNSSAYMLPPRETKRKIIIASRHPIDVLRMSDFKRTGIQSCHTPGASHFKHCRYEAKDNAGGGVLFSMDADKFDAVFPDGQIPQTGDIFDDDDRDVQDVLPAPDARLRLRKVINMYDNTEYAVPDKRIYPSYGDPAFIDSAFEYFADKQKDKFQEGGKFALPIPSELVRFGGSYEDGGEQTVGENFLKLVDTVIKVGNKEALIKSDSYLQGTYDGMKIELKRGSIKWGGDAAEEDELDADPCGELQTAAANVNNADMSYFSFYADAECHNDPPYINMQAMASFFFKYDELTDWFRGETVSGKLWQHSSDIKRNMERNDYLQSLCGFSISYPDMEFSDVDIELSSEKDYAIRIRINYSSTVTEPNEVQSKYDDLSRFEDTATYTKVREAIRLSMVDLDMAVESAYETSKDEIDNFANWVEEHEGFTVNEEKKTMEFKYSKLLAEEFVLKLENEKLRTDVQTAMLRRAISEEFNFEFLNMFRRRADRYKKEVAKQLPLFSGMDTRPPDTLAYKNFTDAFPEPTTKPSLDIVLDYKGGFPATPEKQTVKFIFKFQTQLDTSLTEEQIQAQMRYIKELVDDEDVMLEIAYNALEKITAAGYSESAVLDSFNVNEQKKKKITIQEAKEMRKKLKEWMKNRKGVK